MNNLIQIDIGTATSAVIALIVGGAAVGKWIANGHEKKVSETITVMSTAVNGRIKEMKLRIDAQDSVLTDTREKLFSEYARHDHFTSFRTELNTNFDNMFGRIDKVSEQVNQLIGRINNDKE